MAEANEAEVQRLLPLVSVQRREQALRYKHLFGQFCCLKSWMMLRELLNERMKELKNEGVNELESERMNELMDEWEYNEYGKPSFHLSPLTSHLYFSISHCKEGIAVAVDDKPIGIDIESIRHADEELIERTMNESERQLIAKANANADRTFTRLWTQKEAVVKALGTGITSFEQLQKILVERGEWRVESFENEKYIYSIAYKL